MVEKEVLLVKTLLETLIYSLSQKSKSKKESKTIQQLNIVWRVLGVGVLPLWMVMKQPELCSQESKT